jgi:hypothetical protein
MASITVRLSDEDHKLLQLYCLMTGKSQNAVLTELLHAELDRTMPGKRQAVANRSAAGFWQAIGISSPGADAGDDEWARQVIADLGDDADRSAA